MNKAESARLSPGVSKPPTTATSAVVIRDVRFTSTPAVCSAQIPVFIVGLANESNRP